MRTHPPSGYGKHAARPRIRCPRCGRVLAGRAGTGYLSDQWAFLPPHVRNPRATARRREWCVGRGQNMIADRMPRP